MSAASNTVKAEIELDENTELEFVTGEFQKNIKMIEKSLGVAISARGAKIMVQGGTDAVETAKGFINQLREVRKSGHHIRQTDIRYALGTLGSGDSVSLKFLFENNIPVSPRKHPVAPKNTSQLNYIEAIKTHDMVFGIGPAGTGKTYLAMAMAVNALLNKSVSRIILARPAVEAGERLGFLPGDLIEKVNPYLRPLYDALFDMMEVERANKLIEQGIIEIAPLAFMRGRTLNDAFIILDEAQNTTSEQMKMYLTRLGFGSKTVITGDVTQIDLPSGKVSGLVEAERILCGVEEIKIIYFGDKDVVRHRLVQKIVKAYGKHEKRLPEKTIPKDNG